MCLPIAAVAAVASTAASVGGSLMSFAGQKKQAAQQQLYNMQVQTQQLQYRLEATEWSNEVYKEEVKYGGKMLEWQKGEFKKQEKFLDRATENIQKNYFAQIGQLLQRSFEEDVAATFNVEAVQDEARGMRAKVTLSAAERGIEGTSVEQIINDVSRQQGNAESVLEMNRSAVQRQLGMEAKGIKAAADGQLLNLPMQTFQPMGQIKAPAPISPVNPAAPVAQPSVGAAVANVVGGVVGGMQNYATWSGQSMSQAFRL